MSEKWKYFCHSKAEPPFYLVTTVPTKKNMHYETIARCSSENDAACIVADHNKSVNRDVEWCYAITVALSDKGEHNIPIVPEPEPFRKLFQEIRDKVSSSRKGE